MLFQRDCGDGRWKCAIETGIWMLLAASGREGSLLRVQLDGVVQRWHATTPSNYIGSCCVPRIPHPRSTSPTTRTPSRRRPASTRKKSQMYSRRILDDWLVPVGDQPMRRVSGAIAASSGQAVAPAACQVRLRYRRDTVQQRTRRRQLDQ